MAGLIFSPEARAQFEAIARVRWQLFVNSLRTIRGRLELLSRIILGGWLAIFGAGGAIGLAFAAWYFVSEGKPEWLAALLWPVFLFWQLFPVMATAFTENFDSSNLLRFPLSYQSFFMIRMVYGSLDPATAVGLVWTLGMAIGIVVADPAMFVWAATVLLVFAAFNILLGRMVFAWIERWLAQRRTREILGIVFVLLAVGFQFIGPLMGRYNHGKASRLLQILGQFLPVERITPPGLAAQAISRAAGNEFLPAIGGLVLQCVYALAVLGLLHLRVRAQYRGENWSETVGRGAAPRRKLAVTPGWSLRGLPGPITAVFEKELRYLFHSTAMFMPMVMPVAVLLIFRLTPGASGRDGGLLSRTPDLAFPAGAAYALMILSNFVYNSFGPEGSGVQFYFVSPVSFRAILLAKNLAHTAILVLEMSIVWIAVCFLFAPPSPAITLATLAGIFFALLVNLTAGNVISLSSPRKVDYATFGRQRGSHAAVLGSLGIQFGIIGLAFATLFLARAHGKIWIATVIFLALAAVAFAGYAIVLSRADRMALGHREVLAAELART